MEELSSHNETDRKLATLFKPLMVLRIAITGLLMGLANLVPGVSGGTMVLVMGLYDEFISSVAEVSCLKITKRNVFFLGLLVLVAAICLISLAKYMALLVTTHRSTMYSLFIGLTLGGAPLLYHLMKPLKGTCLVMIAAGFLTMCTIAATKNEDPEKRKEEAKALQETGEFRIEPNYPLDLAAGALGMSAMVLPGISGAYMLLILGRYEVIYAAIGATQHAVRHDHNLGDPVNMQVIIPVAIGAILSLVILSNLLKWLLRRYEKLTLGFLLGVLLGSVVGIWPFSSESLPMNYVIGLILIGVGFAATCALAQLSRAKNAPETNSNP